MLRWLRLSVLMLVLCVLAGCSGGSVADNSAPVGASPYLTAPVGDARLAYRVHGEGEPLLMVMGFAGTMDIWGDALIDELARQHKVIVFDNRGMGGSTGGGQPLSIAGMADDCAGLLDALGIERAHVFGWSMGGLIAQELALRHPQRVKKLVLMGAACDNAPVAKTTRDLLGMDLEELLSHFFPRQWLAAHPDAFSTLPRPAGPADPEVVGAQAQAMIDWPGSCERLPDLEKDVLIITGMRDDILPEPESVRMAQAIRGAWLVRYKNAAHWLLYQDPESLARIVSTFLVVRADLLAP